MAMEWYNKIAKRNGGYRVNVPYRVEGVSAEDVFEEALAGLIADKVVLDAGCGHGDFTLRMAAHAREIVGYDFAEEMIRIASRLKEESACANASFLHTRWGEMLPFAAGTFDVIYSRRGPGSIVEQAGLLKPGGIMLGIHIHPIPDGEITDRARRTGAYEEIAVQVYEAALITFSNADDYAEYLPRHEFEDIVQ